MEGLINARCSPRHRALLQRASPRPPRRPPALWGVLWQSDFFESSGVCKLLHS